MNGAERRREILSCIKGSQVPISGTKLAQRFHVSRQIIVQDIALLRTSNPDIIATNKGYICPSFHGADRVFGVCHKDSEILEELNLIVDFGGMVENVYVNHEVYGKLKADLNINNRKKAADFFETIQNGQASPLKNITSGYHYHRVRAESEATLDLIETELKKRGFLVAE